MSAYRRKDRGGEWWFRKQIRLPDGTKYRVHVKPPINTKAAAEISGRAEIERRLNPAALAPTFAEWWSGRYWAEAVEAESDNQTERTKTLKRSLYRNHLGPALGHLRLDEIDVGVIQRFKLELADKPGRKPGSKLSAKSRSNIILTLSHALTYAEEAGVIASKPRVRAPRIVKPEIEPWEFADYLTLLAAADADARRWLVAVLLGADAGLRLGEIRGLEWGDVDLHGDAIHVRRQRGPQGEVGPPKWGSVRTAPMSGTLCAALSSLPASRGRVVAGTPAHVDKAIRRLCKAAGLEVSGWHRLRHTFGANCARFGANPWELKEWMGHRSITTTEQYVNLVKAHRRKLPDRVAAALAAAPVETRALAGIAALSSPALATSADMVPIRRGPNVDPGISERENGAPVGSDLVRAVGFEPSDEVE